MKQAEMTSVEKKPAAAVGTVEVADTVAGPTAGIAAVAVAGTAVETIAARAARAVAGTAARAAEQPRHKAFCLYPPALRPAGHRLKARGGRGPAASNHPP